MVLPRRHCAQVYGRLFEDITMQEYWSLNLKLREENEKFSDRNSFYPSLCQRNTKARDKA